MPVKERKKRHSSDHHTNRMIGLRLPEEVRQEIEAMATVEYRPLATMCAVLVLEALAARKKPVSSQR
jgi:hypothetical protein